jgi:hypothetical protein
MYIYIYIHVSLSMYMYMHVYLYVYYMYIYTYMYIYIMLPSLLVSCLNGPYLGTDNDDDNVYYIYTCADVYMHKSLYVLKPCLYVPYPGTDDDDDVYNIYMNMPMMMFTIYI